METLADSAAKSTPPPSRNIDDSSSKLSPLPLPSSVARLWNQWSLLSSFKSNWSNVSSSATSLATSIVNSHLSLRYIPNLNLGVLSHFPLLKSRASFKLFHQQELQRSKLLLSYKNMVRIVSDMFNASRLMRCYFKGANNSPLLQFSCYSEDKSDSGDGDGIPVFAFLSVSSHEKFAEELVQMYSLELCLKRLLFLEFLSIGYDTSLENQLHWSTQLYAGEFDDLRDCNLYCQETCGPVPPRLRDGKSDISGLRFDDQPNPEVLQVYLTTWLAEVNIDTFRVNKIFTIVGEEMHVNLC